MCNLWGWAKLYIGEEMLSLIGWLLGVDSLHLGVGVFCSFLVGRPLSPRILPVCFAALLPLDNIFCVYLLKK